MYEVIISGSPLSERMSLQQKYTNETVLKKAGCLENSIKMCFQYILASSFTTHFSQLLTNTRTAEILLAGCKSLRSIFVIDVVKTSSQPRKCSKDSTKLCLPATQLDQYQPC